ncbi:hypothetical protein GKZ68_05585 [Hymenobacter sp. BRD128]|uniref:hypothetical protein n=1 Tax=Hymenobacter sp. BRD128 TaxID=2675878 RepID=UPI0015633E72|nr:hypothetical protein [Hymenobacter sp. BRD128]QKG56161.1 hypothetical protein GKZ68_05585 [Hymenobacter sp. BRD128]
MKGAYYMLSLLMLNSCTFTCNEVKNEFYMGRACNIVVESNRSTPRNMEIYGYNPENNSKEKYVADGNVYIELISALEVGDTLIKNNDEPFFILKKKQFAIKFGMNCGSRNEFAGVAIDTLRR